LTAVPRVLESDCVEILEEPRRRVVARAGRGEVESDSDLLNPGLRRVVGENDEDLRVCGTERHFVRHVETWRGVLRRASHEDRKSTRLNSSHLGISYAVF